MSDPANEVFWIVELPTILYFDSVSLNEQLMKTAFSKKQAKKRLLSKRQFSKITPKNEEAKISFSEKSSLRKLIREKFRFSHTEEACSSSITTVCNRSLSFSERQRQQNLCPSVHGSVHPSVRQTVSSNIPNYKRENGNCQFFFPKTVDRSAAIG